MTIDFKGWGVLNPDPNPTSELTESGSDFISYFRYINSMFDPFGGFLQRSRNQLKNDKKSYFCIKNKRSEIKFQIWQV